MHLKKLLAFALCLCLLAAGCSRPAGKAAATADQLNGNWVLQRLKGQPLDAGRTPNLDFQVSQNRVTGHTGCNRLSGTFQVQGKRLAFGRLITTKMACLGQSTERPFLAILNDSTLTFKLKPGTLTLLQDNKPVLEFKKAD